MPLYAKPPNIIEGPAELMSPTTVDGREILHLLVAIGNHET